MSKVNGTPAASSSTSTATFGASATVPFTSPATASDPYTYQVGFGNRFASEAVPNTLPIARNTPQRVKYDLYSEQLNGSAFATIRSEIQQV